MHQMLRDKAYFEHTHVYNSGTLYMCLVNSRALFMFSVMRDQCPTGCTTHHETTPNGHNWYEICKQGRTRKVGIVTEGILHQQTKA